MSGERMLYLFGALPRVGDGVELSLKECKQRSSAIFWAHIGKNSVKNSIRWVTWEQTERDRLSTSRFDIVRIK